MPTALVGNVNTELARSAASLDELAPLVLGVALSVRAIPLAADGLLCLLPLGAGLGGFEGADASGFEEDARLTAMWLWTLHTTANGDEVGAEEKTEVLRGYSLEYDAARKIAQGLGAHLEDLSHLVEIKGNIATLLTAGARTRYLFGAETPETPRRRRKNKPQMALDFASEIRELEVEYGDWSADLTRGPGSTVLDQLHQSMILFGAGRGEALRRFLVEDGVGRHPLFWRLAQALSALYPAITKEKRWVDGVLGRKKGFGL